MGNFVVKYFIFSALEMRCDEGRTALVEQTPVELEHAELEHAEQTRRGELPCQDVLRSRGTWTSGDD